MTSYATSRGIRTRGVGEVVGDEPRGEPMHPVARARRSNRRRAARKPEVPGQVVDDEPRDEPSDKPHDVSRHPDARPRRSSRRRPARQAEAPGRAV
jgi:hypothetical protein